MSETPKDSKKDIDISSAMDKIVEDTIGHIPVTTPTPIKKNQKNSGSSKNPVDKADGTAKLPSKKKVTVDAEAERKDPKKAAQPKKEVELFFPTSEKATLSKTNQKADATKSTSKEKPEVAKKRQSKQTRVPQSQQTKAGQSQQTKTGQSKQSKAGQSQQTKAGQSKQSKAGQSQQTKDRQSQQTKAGQSKQSKAGQSQQTKAGQSNQAKAGQQSKTQSKQTKARAAKKANQQNQNNNKAQQPKQNPKRSKGPSPAPALEQLAQSVQMAEAPKKKHPVRNALLGLLGMVLLGALGVYGYFAYYYQDKFIPGTVINQIDAHELSGKQVEEQIRKRVEDYAIEIDFRDGKKESISGESIDYAFVSDGSVDKILSEQNSLLWIAGHFNEYRYEIPESITFNNDKLMKEYNKLPELQRKNQEKPEDAYVFYQNQNWEIVPEVEGTAINSSILYPEISSTIHASIRECSAEEAKAYIEPKIRKDDPKLATEVRELNELVGASIMYKLPQGDEVLDGNMLKLWIQKDAKGHYSKDEEIFKGHVESYVERLADATDTLGKPKKFTTTSGKEVTVESKVYGWKVDRYAETEKLKEELATNAKATREPEYVQREFTMENNGFGDTYIEVDLSLQHMYVYDKGRLVLDSDIVSGRMTSKRWTPPGVFLLRHKQKGKVLRGPLQPDGSYEWESPVSYWMPFNGGIGFHDATWQSAFGGDRYLYRGSHGCINMPYKKAQALYDIISSEFPIICVYSENNGLYD